MSDAAHGRSSVWGRLRGRLETWLFRTGLERAGFLVRWAMWGAQVAYLSMRQFWVKHCPERAGALGFATMISLIPLTVLFLGILGVVGSAGEMREFIDQRVLVYFFPDPDLREAIVRQLHSELETQVFQLRTLTQVVALVSLVAAALFLLVSAERIVNRLWEVGRERGYLQKLKIFWIVLTTSPAAFAASLFFDWFTAEGTVIGSLREKSLFFSALYTFLLPGVVLLLAFFVLNYFLPNTRVRAAAALSGAFVSAGFWEFAKRGFYWYVQNALATGPRGPGVGRFYGSLWVLPAFLLWVYVTWIVALFGVMVTYVVQNRRSIARRLAGGAVGAAVSPPSLLLWLLHRIFGAFARGERIAPVEELAEAASVRVEAVEPLLNWLVERGVLVRAKVSEGDGLVRLFVPAQAAERIRLRDLVAALPPELAAIPPTPGFPVEASHPVVQLHDASRAGYLSALGDKTLQDLVLWKWRGGL